MSFRLTLILTGAVCAALAGPTLAADEKAPVAATKPAAAPAAAKPAAAPAAATAAADATKGTADAAKTKHTEAKKRRAECEKQAKDKHGMERKKFIRDCMLAPASTATAAKPADTAKPADAKPATAAKADKPAAPEPSHKDAYPAERLKENPRLRNRSCAMDADDKGLVGAERQTFLKNCIKTQ